MKLPFRIELVFLLLVPACVSPVYGFAGLQQLQAGEKNAFLAPAPSLLSTRLHATCGSNLFTTQSSCKDRNSRQVVVNNRHSASDWFYNVRSIAQSEILREVRGPVVAVATWSLVVSVMHRLLLALSNGGANHWSRLAQGMLMPGTAHSFLVSALGLLLVFRTNSAYQRFYEGRKIWENILSVSRNLSRLIQLYSPEVGPARQSRILHLVAAFPYLLRHHIRPGCLCTNKNVEDQYRLRLVEPTVPVVETRHEGYKSCAEDRARSSRDCWVDRRDLPWSLFQDKQETRSLERLAVAHNRPLWVCDRMAHEIMKIPYGPNFTSRERLTMLGQVEKLTNFVGQCERIQQTAVPLNYARHSLRSLTLWLFTLPFCLIKDLGLLTAPVTACIAWVLFGVYQIGYSIEDPFQGSLRLSILCDAIRRDVLGHADEMDRLAFQQELGEEDNDMWGEMSWIDHMGNNSSENNKKDKKQVIYQPLPLLDKEEAFLSASPKLIHENGTWNLVDAVEN